LTLRAYEESSSATAVDKQPAHVAMMVYVHEPETTVATQTPEVIDLAMFLCNEDLRHRAISSFEPGLLTPGYHCDKPALETNVCPIIRSHSRSPNC
jgi:hypothetical protein